MKSKLILPTGSLGVAIHGKPASVRKTTDESPLKGLVHRGQFVTEFVIPNKVTISGPMEADDVVALLAKTAEVADREMYLEDKKTASFLQVVPVWKVTLPSGKLGVSFKPTDPEDIESVPMISKIKEDSPLAEIAQVGFHVSELCIPGKGEFSSPTTAQLAELIRLSQEVEGRVLVLEAVSATEEE